MHYYVMVFIKINVVYIFDFKKKVSRYFVNTKDWLLQGLMTSLLFSVSPAHLTSVLYSNKGGKKGNIITFTFVENCLRDTVVRGGL